MVETKGKKERVLTFVYVDGDEVKTLGPVRTTKCMVEDVWLEEREKASIPESTSYKCFGGDLKVVDNVLRKPTYDELAAKAGIEVPEGKKRFKKPADKSGQTE